MSVFGDGPRWGPASGGAPKQLVLLLHGVGADGFDLIDLAPVWGEAVPDALFIAPHGPEPCDLAPYGRQWFSLQDRSDSRMSAELSVAAAVLGDWLDGELAQLGLTRADCALVGFSQGAMTALFTGLRQAPAPAAILGYSGRLVGADTLRSSLRSSPPVLLVHGEADEVVPVGAGRHAESVLREAGVAVQALYRPGLAHGIDDEGIAAGAEALRRAFGLAA